MTRGTEMSDGKVCSFFIALITPIPSLSLGFNSLAQHITYVHAHNDFPVDHFQPLDREFLRNYIALAKTFNPYVGQELTESIAARYAKMREEAESVSLGCDIGEIKYGLTHLLFAFAGPWPGPHDGANVAGYAAFGDGAGPTPIQHGSGD